MYRVFKSKWKLSVFCEKSSEIDSEESNKESYVKNYRQTKA